MWNEILEVPAHFLHLHGDLEHVLVGEVGEDGQHVVPVPALHVHPAVSSQIHLLSMIVFSLAKMSFASPFLVREIVKKIPYFIRFKLCTLKSSKESSGSPEIKNMTVQ